MTAEIRRISTFGFARGSIVGRRGGGPHMIVVRQIDDRTIVVVCEGQRDGMMRMRDIASVELELRLASATPADGADR